MDEKTQTKIVYSANLKFLEEFSNKQGESNSFAIYSVRIPIAGYKNIEGEYEETKCDNQKFLDANKKMELKIGNNTAFSFLLKLKSSKVNIEHKVPSGRIVVNKNLSSLFIDGMSIVPHNESHITLLSIIKYDGKEKISLEVSRIYKKIINLNLFNLIIIPEGVELNLEKNNEDVVIFF